MVPKNDIDKKIQDQKSELLERLSLEIKLLVTDIVKVSFNQKDFTGKLLLTIAEFKKFSLDFKLEDGKFYWDVQSLSTSLDNIWFQIYTENKDLFFEKVCDLLNLTEEQILRVSSGKTGVLYVYRHNVLAPDLVKCVNLNNEWVLTI